MTNSIDEVFKQLFSEWLESGSGPESPMEGVTPEFASALSSSPEEFTFDSLLRSADVPGWSWRAIEFNEVFDGPFLFYLPTAWSEVRDQGPAVKVVGDEAAPRQYLRVMEKASDDGNLMNFIESRTVVAFDYYPLHNPGYDRWVFAAKADSESHTWTFGAYSAGDWIVVVQGSLATLPS